MATVPQSKLEQIIEDFAFLDDWEDRYRYIIELGRTLTPLPKDAYCEENKVRGCASQVWLLTDQVSKEGAGEDGPILSFRGDSDAHIVKGLIAVLLAIYSGKSAEEIAQLDPAGIFAQIGLDDHLTPQRSNGLASMVARIRSDAAQAVVRPNG